MSDLRLYAEEKEVVSDLLPHNSFGEQDEEAESDGVREYPKLLVTLGVFLSWVAINECFARAIPSFDALSAILCSLTNCKTSFRETSATSLPSTVLKLTFSSNCDVWSSKGDFSWAKIVRVQKLKKSSKLISKLLKFFNFNFNLRCFYKKILSILFLNN